MGIPLYLIPKRLTKPNPFKNGSNSKPKKKKQINTDTKAGPISPSSSPTIDRSKEWKIIAENHLREGTAKKNMPSLQKAFDQLRSVATTLFKKAFLSKNRLKTDLYHWNAFVVTINTSGAHNQSTNFLIALSHPKLKQDDRELLFTFFTTNRKDPKNKPLLADLTRTIVKKFISHWKKEGEHYLV